MTSGAVRIAVEALVSLSPLASTDELGGMIEAVHADGCVPAYLLDRLRDRIQRATDGTLLAAATPAERERLEALHDHEEDAAEAERKMWDLLRLIDARVVAQ